MTTPARQLHMQHTHQISRSINFGDANAAIGQIVGMLPAGAIVDKVSVITDTAFNGTTSVALSVGQTLLGTDYINATDVRTAAARVDTVAPIAKAGPLAADTPVYASIAFGGTIGTAGRATVIVYYIAAVG